ncbi:MAG: AAA family ATPase [Candidatus Eisenbacteria bacterium]|nr:AAA family ATPase [Candidatus Eisenbacteria bacterium]
MIPVADSGSAPRLIDRTDRRLASGLDGGLEGTWLVEAGAGTGKTTVLVDRIVANLAAGVPFDRIVAITFTEKAAGELRLRVRQKLEQLAGAAGETEGPLREALRSIDRAEIGTIHGFASRLVRERPVEVGVDPGFAVADALTQTILQKDAWDEWFRDELSRDDVPALGTIRRLGTRDKRIRDIAFQLVAHRDMADLVPDPGKRPDIAPLLSAFREGAAELDRLVADGCSNEEDTAAILIRSFSLAVEDARFVPEHALPAYLLREVTPGPGSNKGNKKNWDADALDAAREVGTRLRELQAETLLEAGHHAAAGLMRWLLGFVEHYQAVKRERGFLDFDDLLIEARNLLRDNRDVRRHFKRAFDRILIDEFQDTDPLQCEIAFFLAEREGAFETRWQDVELEPGKLFIVGDPKQSIYRFRRADIEVYEEAKRVIEHARGTSGVLTLTQNFRTRPAIVSELNEAFAPTMVAPEGERRYQPDYEPLTSFRERDARGPGVVLLPPPFDISEGLDDGPRGSSFADLKRALEASTVAAFVARLVNDPQERVWDKTTGVWRRVRLSDIAVLFRTGTALEHYEDAFDAHGLDYRIAGGKRYYARREVRELATVLAAVEDPHDLVAVVGALRTPFFGVPDDAVVLHRHRTGGLDYLRSTDGDPRVEEAFALLRELHHARDTEQTPRVIERLFRLTGTPELYLMKPSGEQRHANLMKVVELATSLGEKELLSFGGFARWLDDVTSLTPEEAESPLSEEGDEFVRMLTIHKSKGLEFPVTVLADLSGGTRHTSPFIVDREAGRLSLRIGAKDSGIETSNDRSLRELERKREDAERIRLLYVGTTRARDLLVIPWFEGGRMQKKSPLGDLEVLRSRAEEPGAWLDTSEASGTASLDTSLLDRERPRPAAVRVDFEATLKADPEETVAHEEKRAWEQRMRSLPKTADKGVSYLTPSSLAEHGATGRDPTAEPMEDLPSSGADVGTLVHAVLERIDLERPDDVEELARSLARTEGLAAEAVADAAALLERALGTPTLRRAAAAHTVLREAPFCMRDGNRFVEGKIDLVFEDDDGLVVVDYKTDVVPEGGTAALADAYRRQAEAYAAAVERVAGRPPTDVLLLALRADEPEVAL